MGLVNRVVPRGQARQQAEALARELAALPQTCLRSDRMSTLLQMDEPQPLAVALGREFRLGTETIRSGETATGAQRFSDGAGRHGMR
jgi:enoyl-CoA hydratase